METGKSNTNNFCDSLYTELYSIRTKLEKYAAVIEQDKGQSKEKFLPYTKHLHDIVSFIDWKMEIFNRICPIEWKNLHIESEVSVPPLDLSDTELPGGYLGG